MTGDTTIDRASAPNRLINPGPHPLNKRTLVGLLIGIVVFAVLWVLSVSAYSAEPAEVPAPAITAKTGLQAVVRAVNFNQNTEMLTMRLDFTAVGDLVDSRGILTTDVDLRVGGRLRTHYDPQGVLGDAGTKVEFNDVLLGSADVEQALRKTMLPGLQVLPASRDLVGAEACRAGALPAKALLTTYLKTESGGDFFPLMRDVDLRKDLPKEAAPERIPLCM